MQTAWSTYLRGLLSYFTIWRQKNWFCLTANFKMNLWRVCTTPQISLGDILYLCHIPSGKKAALLSGWFDGNHIPGFSLPLLSCLPLSVLTFFGCHSPLEEGSHLLWIIPCSEPNVTTQTCSHVNTGTRKWSRQIAVAGRNKDIPES